MIEDDSQSGIDHISPFRSIMVAMGPYVKRSYVTKVNLTGAGLNKTIFEILGIPPLNLYDALATDYRDIFTMQPDFTPYNFITPVYQPNSASSIPPPVPGVPLPQQLPAGSFKLAPYSSQRIREAAIWNELTQDVNFSRPDADECRMNRALMRYFGIPRAPLKQISDEQLDRCLTKRRDGGDDD